MERRERLYVWGLAAMVLASAAIIWLALGTAPDAPEPAEPTAEADDASAHEGPAIRGQVLDLAGDPVESAEVLANDRKVRTDANGEFELTDLQPGTWRLDAAAPGWVSPGPADARRLAVTLAAPREGEEPPVVEGVRLRLRQPGRLRGRVVAAGEPVAGARLDLFYVYADGQGGPLQAFTLERLTTSAPDGTFSLEDVAPGRLRVVAQAAGHATAESREIALADAEERDGIVLDLAPAAAVRGTVRSREGRPVTAEVVLAGGGLVRNRRVQTAADGTFRLDGVPPGTYALHARAPGFQPLTVEPLVVDAAARPLDLVLEAAAGLWGRVVDARDAPVPGALVVVRGVRPGGVAHGDMTVRTDDQGAFQLPAAGPDLVGASALAYGPHHAPSSPQEVRPGEPLVLRLGDGGSVSGRVVDGAGQPVAQFALAVEGAVFDGPDPFGAAAVPPQRVADSGGSFRLGPLRPGRYDLRAEAPGLAPGFARGVVVPAGGSTDGVTIVLPVGAVVAGRVTSAVDGAPVPRAMVTLFEPMSTLPPRTTVTDADGQYRLTGVAPGRRSVRVGHREFLTELASGVDVPAQGEVRRDVVLRKGAPGERFSFQGIGATLRRSERGIEIMNTLEGTPGARAGLQSGDVILAVDRESTQDMQLGQVVELIRGQEGVPVVLEIERAGQGRVLVTVERGRVVVQE